MDPESEFDRLADTFLVEIRNVMTFSLDPKDAFFMVSNITGKLMRVSRCIIIRGNTDTWTTYEFWDRQRVDSCQKLNWPQRTSLLLETIRTASSPIQLERSGESSPLQEELRYISAESVLGHSVSDHAFRICLILQQCDRKRVWTQKEISWSAQVCESLSGAFL
jgi:hypothetical protein